MWLKTNTKQINEVITASWHLQWIPASSPWLAITQTLMWPRSLWTADQPRAIYITSAYHTWCLPTRCALFDDAARLCCSARRLATIRPQASTGPTRTTGCWSARCASSWQTSTDLSSARTCTCSGPRASSMSSTSRFVCVKGSLG